MREGLTSVTYTLCQLQSHQGLLSSFTHNSDEKGTEEALPRGEIRYLNQQNEHLFMLISTSIRQICRFAHALQLLF